MLRNLPLDDPKKLAELITIKPNQVISMSFTKSKHMQMTLFAFAKGEDVSEEAYFGDTMYMAVEGEVHIITDSREYILQAGEIIMIPAQTLHAVKGPDAFKMLQITVME